MPHTPDPSPAPATSDEGGSPAATSPDATSPDAAPAPARDAAGSGGGTGAGGRRALLTAATTAALGALGVAVARPAAAAAGGAALLGRVNLSGTATTTFTSTSTVATTWSKGVGGHGCVAETASSSRWGVVALNKATATGPAGAVRADGGRNVGLVAVTSSNLVWAARAVNTGASADSAPGGALRAEGRLNTGLFADTDPGVADVPAVLAIGGDGEFNGTAVLASGTTYLDGQALALRSYTGVLAQDPDTGNTFLVYAPATSGEEDYHTVTDAVTLDGTGAATVDLSTGFSSKYKDYPVAVDMTTLRVSLTAVGVAMPNLHVGTLPANAHDTSFGIAGGEANGTVHFTISAKRMQVTLADVAAASVAAAPMSTSARTRGGAATSPRVVRTVGPRVR